MEWDGHFGLTTSRRAPLRRTASLPRSASPGRRVAGSPGTKGFLAPTFSSLAKTGSGHRDRPVFSPSRRGYDDSVRATFMRFDRNRSGRLDYRELRNALRALGLDVTTNESARVLARYDADGSGLMEIDEFERLVRRLGYGPRYHGGGMPSGARNGQWQTVTSPGARGRAGLPITPRRSRSAPRVRPATFGGSGGYGGYRPALLDY